MEHVEGKRFGRYEVLDELGRGAMGVVYKARDPMINRIVAVKTISLTGQAPEEEQEYRQRFIREAEAAGRLSHPGIVTIFDVGEEPETRVPYIVMEYVGGESLDKLLSRDGRKLPVEKALQLAMELAEALDCAHAQGVVHRDLKPANILLTEDGHAKIADFGVAKLNLSNQTLAGRALGTPAYMSPEQLNGDPVDGRSDLFSLGVILYTVLTGHRPFQGNSALTVSFKVVNRDPIPATLLDTELPEGLDALIARAMAKDPAERYQRGAEMMRDIRRLKETQKAPGKKKPPVVVPVAVAGAAAAAAPAAAPATLTTTRPIDDETPPVLSGHPQIAAKVLVTAKSVTVEPHLLALIRRKSLVGVFVLTGLFLLGLWVISFGPQGVRPRAAESASPVTEGAPVKSDETLDSSAATPASSTTPAETAADQAAATSRPVSPAAKPVSKPVKSASATAGTAASLSAATSHAATDIAKTSLPKRISPPATKVAKVTVPEEVFPSAPAVTPATLQIVVDHKFAEAHLSIWVDGSLTYTHLLEGTAKKRLVVFHHVQGHETDSMTLSPGKHSLRVQVTSEAASYDQFATLAGDFDSGKPATLHVNCNKRGEIGLTLQ